MFPRVLVVDDEHSLLKMLEDILGLLGCTVVAVPTLDEGLQRACEDEFDLLLLDNHFPGGHGDEIVPAVVAARPEMPIVIITANESDAHVLAALDMGAREVLPKPFGLDDLMSLMERHCPSFRRQSRVA